jgi:hypothetical protein
MYFTDLKVPVPDVVPAYGQPATSQLPDECDGGILAPTLSGFLPCVTH